MVGPFTSKNEEDPIKNEVVRVATTFSPLKIYGNIFGAQGHVTPKLKSYLVLNRTHAKSCGWSCYLQDWRRSIKNEGT